MSTLTIVLLAGAGIVVLFFIVAALQPTGFRVARGTTINAPAGVVYGQISDFRRWQAWSPWEKMDPAMKREFDGAPAGAGAGYRWVGNKKVGEGRMTIVEARPNEVLRIKLEFIAPFAATNQATFTLEEAAGKTAVDWAMTGNRNLMFKAFGLFMSMEKMIGPDFERGLAQLKAVAENPPR